MSVRFLLVVLAFILACGSTPPSPKNLPPPVPSTAVGPGDVFEVNVVGEKEWPHEFRVEGDGTIDYPYVKHINVNNLEPNQVANAIRLKLIEEKILTNPQVTVLVKTYASKKVSVIGQVNKPGSVPWLDGMKIVDAIVQSGGFTSIADSNHVILTRVTSKEGKTITVTVSVDAITDGKQPDIPLQVGDTIKIDARAF